MKLIGTELPKTTVVSVGHREELQEFHDRKIVLEHRKGGARIVSDENLGAGARPRLGLLRRIMLRGKRDLPPLSVPERHPGDRLTGTD